MASSTTQRKSPRLPYGPHRVLCDMGLPTSLSPVCCSASSVVALHLRTQSCLMVLLAWTLGHTFVVQSPHRHHCAFPAVFFFPSPLPTYPFISCLFQGKRAPDLQEETWHRFLPPSPPALATLSALQVLGMPQQNGSLPNTSSLLPHSPQSSSVTMPGSNSRKVKPPNLTSANPAMRPKLPNSILVNREDLLKC